MVICRETILCSTYNHIILTFYSVIFQVETLIYPADYLIIKFSSTVSTKERTEILDYRKQAVSIKC